MGRALELYSPSPSNWQPLLCVIHGDHKEHCHLTKRWRTRFLDADFKDALALQFPPKAFTGTSGLQAYLDDSLARENIFARLKLEKRALVLEFVFNSKDWERGGKEKFLPALLAYWADKTREWVKADVHLQHCLVFVCVGYDGGKNQDIRNYFKQYETLKLEGLDLNTLAARHQTKVPALVLPSLESIDYEDADRWAQKQEVISRFGENIQGEVMRLYERYKENKQSDEIPMLELSDALYTLWKQSPEGA